MAILARQKPTVDRVLTQRESTRAASLFSTAESSSLTLYVHTSTLNYPHLGFDMRTFCSSPRFVATSTLCAVAILLCGADDEDNKKASSTLAMGESNIEDRLDAETVERVVAYYLPDLQSCVSETDEDHGDITLRWFISTRGTMEELEIKESSVESDEISDCLVDHVDEWTFPEPRPEERGEVVQQFEVQSSDDSDSDEPIEDAAALAAFSDNPSKAAMGEPDIQSPSSLTALDDEENSSEGLGRSDSDSTRVGENPTSSEPRITPGQPTVNGELDKVIIQRVTRQNRREILNCYERKLREDPNLSGELIIKWVITPNGDVASAEIDESDLDDEGVEDCITSRIDRWVFPEPDGGGVVRVHYPLEFDIGQ